ncbi:ATP-binding protein [Streptomyces sp. Je 1-332]|uniref:ATP-binding protein n=1 Tax=Streptomyces sp. Je 1-332 TaxID=3231270 RepID=UPI0034578172
MTTRRTRVAVAGDPSAVAYARDRILMQAIEWDVPIEGDMRDAVELVASELVTNAVVHSEGMVMVGLYYHPEEGRLLLVVHDGKSEPPRRQHATADDESGRGLALVDSFASRNGWELTERGKKVWAEFDVSVHAQEAGRTDPLGPRLQAVPSASTPTKRDATLRPATPARSSRDRSL